MRCLALFLGLLLAVLAWSGLPAAGPCLDHGTAGHAAMDGAAAAQGGPVHAGHGMDLAASGDHHRPPGEANGHAASGGCCHVIAGSGLMIASWQPLLPRSRLAGRIEPDLPASQPQALGIFRPPALV